MVEKWRQDLDKGGVSGTLIEGISKAYDCILRDLLIAKLPAYSFDYNFLQILQSYLSNGKIKQNLIMRIVNIV